MGHASNEWLMIFGLEENNPNYVSRSQFQNDSTRLDSDDVFFRFFMALLYHQSFAGQDYDVVGE